jgi:PBP1b-binding outer membrane lipoprotein LpoB
VINQSTILRTLMFIAAALILVSCNQATPLSYTPTAAASPTSALPTPQVETTSVPDPENVARDYLDHWKAEDYPAM